MNLNKLRPYLLYQFSSDSELVKAIVQLSDNFTKSRENIEDYLTSDRLVSAYSCFYLTTNYPKLEKIFELVNLKFEQYQEFEIVDIGSGPGTFILSFLNKLPDNQYIAIETSKKMQEQGKRIIQGFFPESNVSWKNSPEPKTEGKKRLGLFTHSANEMSTKQVIQYIKNWELDEVLFLEPGTKEFFKKSLEIRTLLLKENYNISYPCPSQKECPMGEDNWCHQFIKISHPDDVKRLCQLVKKDRSLLPMTIHHYVADEFVQKEIHRIVRTYPVTKFSIEMDLCKIDGEKNKIIHFQQMTRGLKKPEIKYLNGKLSGELITFKLVKRLPDGTIRGELIEN